MRDSADDQHLFIDLRLTTFCKPDHLYLKKEVKKGRSNLPTVAYILGVNFLTKKVFTSPFAKRLTF